MATLDPVAAAVIHAAYNLVYSGKNLDRYFRFWGVKSGWTEAQCQDEQDRTGTLSPMGEATGILEELEVLWLIHGFEGFGIN